VAGMTTGMAIEQLPMIDVSSADYLRDPHAVYRVWRERTPVARSSRGVEVLSYELGNRILRDSRLHQPGLYFIEQIGLTDGVFHRIWANIMQHADGDRHARLRRHVMHHFNARAVDALRWVVRDSVTESLQRMGSGGRCEFVRDVAEPIPSRLFCHVIGSPPEDAPTIARLSDQLLVVFAMDPAYRDQLESAAVELEAYVHDCIAQRRRTPGEDWISSLVRSQAEDRQLTDADIVYLVAEGLIASTDNTSQQLSLLMLLLAQDPAQWQELRADRALIRTAVEESMRYLPRLLSVMRIAQDELELDGLVLPAGSLVSVLVAAAGRDPAVYAEPDRFDIRRLPTPGTLNFGAGPHACSGATLARMEMQEALGLLLDAWETVAVDGPVTMNSDNDAQAVSRLPLAVTRDDRPPGTAGAEVPAASESVRCPVAHQ
jgi:cytochrome P450